MRRLAMLSELPNRQASAGPVGLARLGVGAAAVIEVFEVMPLLRRLHDPSLVTAPRFEILPTLPAAAVGLFLGLWVLAALAFCVGWNTRMAGTVLSVLLIYTLALDHQLYTNHLYLMALLVALLTLADSGAAASFDLLGRERRQTIPAWPVILIRLQVSIVYLFAAAAKLNVMYLSGLVLRYQLRLPGLDSIPPAFFALAAIGSVLTEVFLGLAFWNRRLRPIAFIVGVGFHLTILVTMRIMPDLLTFALLMGSAYLSFFSSISPAPVRQTASQGRLETSPQGVTG